MMIGMFAVSEIMRYVVDIDQPWEIGAGADRQRVQGHVGADQEVPVADPARQRARHRGRRAARRRRRHRGVDVATRCSKKFSKEPEKFGTGHVEGIVEAGAANNSALAGAWIPALVFGIPGDSITAIVIGVLYMKNMNPGPTLFMNNRAEHLRRLPAVHPRQPDHDSARHRCASRARSRSCACRASVLMPVILLFCIVGTFAINNSVFGVVLMLVFGIVAYLIEENGFPVAPAILGMVLGAMLEENFISSMIKSDGRLLAFFERPIAGALGALDDRGGRGAAVPAFFSE